MKAGRNLQRSERFEATEGIVSHAGDVVVREVDPFEPPVGRERFRWDFRNVVLLQSPEITAMVFQLTHEFFLDRRQTTYSSVVSSGSVAGTLVRLFSRQSTIPSAHRHGWGHRLRPPHSIGAFSVSPVRGREKKGVK